MERGNCWLAKGTRRGEDHIGIQEAEAVSGDRQSNGSTRDNEQYSVFRRRMTVAIFSHQISAVIKRPDVRKPLILILILVLMPLG